MPTFYTQAVDEMNKLFNDAFAAPNIVSLIGYKPEIFWYGNEREGLPSSDKFWVRHSVQNVLEEQSSLSECEGAVGKKLYDSSGVIIIQFFCPKSTANSLEKGRKLAMIARNAYRGNGTPNGVWFRNARVVDVPDEKPWYRLNVVIEYEFSEIY